MRLTVVVDANPILAALLGGYARSIIFDPRLCFVTTAYTITEVRRYFGRVAKKSGIPESDIEAAFHLLPIVVHERTTYHDMMREAQRRMGSIDPDDVDVVALALHIHAPLWTNDKHFLEVVPPLQLIHTRDFLL